ncbi:hypothetical protein Ancab_016545 [Ancistrocladus abbreviatus]
MINSGATSCFPNAAQGPHHVYAAAAMAAASSNHGGGSMETTADAHLTALICSLSVLKDKVHQVQSLVSMFVSPEQTQHRVGHDSTSMAVVSSMGTLIQEIVVTASSMMFNCQQIAVAASPRGGNSMNKLAALPELTADPIREAESDRHSFFPSESLYWFGEGLNNGNSTNNVANNSINHDNNNDNSNVQQKDAGYNSRSMNMGEGKNKVVQRADDCDIIELDAADLLAKYTHYCQVCGKGFKRDANLRMHMRAHGDEYKSSAALSNPLKNIKNNNNNSNNDEFSIKLPVRKYSCPQEGCRWNRKHAKFQPLKSMICVKNHYKRSHCPKMYVCKRCNRKQFSVLSDLRTHEKHCGDLKWQCSCGTTFSRKDKLMGHVALFVGHTPIINLVGKQLGNVNKDQCC